MIDFVGTDDSTLDRKGRCIVPAGFRKQVIGQPLYIRPSVRGPFLEAWPSANFETDAAPRLGPLDIPADDEDDRLYALIAGVVPVSPDGDGRIILPPHLVEHAGLEASLLFVGRRSFLEIWSKPAFLARMQRAMAAMQRRPGPGEAR
ncbi:MAG: cell division/cell wall cluster transcriptional repressor MraZ [Rubritepida sp.]|jgi:MraZ protein|nr:cell division/cell wall cluster transcriptional repressor MraZ [Rubritepida sp.]